MSWSSRTYVDVRLVFGIDDVLGRLELDYAYLKCMCDVIEHDVTIQFDGPLLIIEYTAKPENIRLVRDLLGKFRQALKLKLEQVQVRIAKDITYRRKED